MGDPIPWCKTVCGVDANCQLTPWEPLIGPGATGERIVDERRAESLLWLHSTALLESCFNLLASWATRWGLGEKATNEPAQIDFLLATSYLGFEGKTQTDAQATARSDHLLLGMVVCSVPKDRGERKPYFAELVAEGDGIRVPRTWEPRDRKVFQAMTTYDMKSDIQRETVRLRQIASSEMKWSEAPQNHYLKRLWKGLRQVDQTILRRAYQLLIREEQRRIRNERAHYEIRDFLQRNGGGYARPQRRRQKLKIPVELGGTANRESWGEQMRDFYQALYTSSDPLVRGRENFQANDSRWQKSESERCIKNHVPTRADQGNHRASTKRQSFWNQWSSK